MSKSYKHMNAETAERARNVKNARKNKNLRSHLNDSDSSYDMERHVASTLNRAPRSKHAY